MDLSLSVSPEAVSGDWHPTATSVSPEGTGSAFGEVFGDAVAVGTAATPEASALPGLPHAFEATALLSFTGASGTTAMSDVALVDLALTGVADADASGPEGVPVEASDDLDETQADEVLDTAVVAPSAHDAVSTLPWGVPVAVVPTIPDAVSTPGAEATGADGTATVDAFGGPLTRPTGMPAAGGGFVTDGEAAMTGTAAESTRQATVAGTAAARGAGPSVADGSAAAETVVTAEAVAVSVMAEGEPSASDMLTHAADTPDTASTEAAAANLLRKKAGAGTDPMASLWTSANPVVRNEALRSLLGQQSTSSESGEPSLADLVKSMARPDTSTPRAALMLAQALRPLELSSVAPGGAERLESVLASRDLEATLDAELPSQLIDAIRLQARSGVQEARIRLRPEVLGEVSIAISVAGGAVSATIEAESSSVRQWIERHEGLLRERLSDQGLQLAQLDVKADDRSRDGERQRREQREASKPAVLSRAQREAAAQRFAAML